MAKAKAKSQPRRIPILLVHTLGDELIPFAHAQQLVAQAQAHGIPIETYFVDHPVHCGAYLRDLEKYTAVIQNFLARHLHDNFPQKKVG